MEAEEKEDSTVFLQYTGTNAAPITYLNKYSADASTGEVEVDKADVEALVATGNFAEIRLPIAGKGKDENEKGEE